MFFLYLQCEKEIKRLILTLLKKFIMKPVFTALLEGIESGAIKSDPSLASVMVVYNDGLFSVSPLAPVTFSSLRNYVSCMYSGRRKKGIKSLMVYLPYGDYENYKYYNILAQF